MQNPAICAFPSWQFYNNKLETIPSSAWMTETPLAMWPQAEQPQVFCHVEGEEEYLEVRTEEGNQKSFKNEQEVQQIVSKCNIH